METEARKYDTRTVLAMRAYALHQINHIGQRKQEMPTPALEYASGWIACATAMVQFLEKIFNETPAGSCNPPVMTHTVNRNNEQTEHTSIVYGPALPLNRDETDASDREEA